LRERRADTGGNIVHLKPQQSHQPNADSSELRWRFFDILRTSPSRAHFQPFVELRKQTMFGYKSFIRRPSDSTLHSPVMLFDLAPR